jgi:hypothetical protein
VETLACLRSLVNLVAEVDGRGDELVVFEEMGARDTYCFELERAQLVLELPDAKGREG